MSRSPLLLLSIVGLVFFVTGCSTTTLSTRYSPLHPSNNQDVTFRVVANDGDGIAKAELYVYEYSLYTNNGMQSAQQRPGGTWGLVKTWNFSPPPSSVDSSHTVSGFPASSYIYYKVRVTDRRGNKKSEQWYFAAGDWPFGNNPIPLLGNGAPDDRIDVCFVADSGDYTSGRAMLGDLEGLIYDGYHINNGIRSNRKYWSFYYSPERGSISDYDTPPLVMDIPSSVSGAAIIDHAAVIHTTVKRDWASGGNFGTEPTNIGTAVHESGHAAFGLSDEYNRGGHSTSTSPHHNNYNSLASAETYNTNNGWPASDVERIQSGWWRPEPSALQCIMLDDGDARMPDFARTCMKRINWFYGELEN